MKNLKVSMEIPKKKFLKAKKDAEADGLIMIGLDIEDLTETEFLTICDYLDCVIDINKFVIEEWMGE